MLHVRRRERDEARHALRVLAQELSRLLPRGLAQVADEIQDPTHLSLQELDHLRSRAREPQRVSVSASHRGWNGGHGGPAGTEAWTSKLGPRRRGHERRMQGGRGRRQGAATGAHLAFVFHLLRGWCDLGTGWHRGGALRLLEGLAAELAEVLGRSLRWGLLEGRGRVLGVRLLLLQPVERTVALLEGLGLVLTLRRGHALEVAVVGAVDGAYNADAGKTQVL